MILFLLASCAVSPSHPDDSSTLSAAGEFEALEAPRLLRRMSLDLRGVLPDLAELEAVEADPSLLESHRDAYLDDPRFADQFVYLLGERWHTLVDTYNAFYYDYRLDVMDEYQFKRSVGSEPLRLMAQTAVDDRPWTDIVTLDTSMANEMLNDIWDLEGYPEGATGWHPVRYGDGRPAAGVLSTNGLWWKYTTTEFNQNRSRAAAVSRLLLCEDLLSRPVEFEVDEELLQSADVSSMVRTEPGCLACHAVIEPLAATLYGFLWVEDKSVVEMESYHPEREIVGPVELGVELAYWGEPISGLEDLGRSIAADPRFGRCAVESMTGTLLRRTLGLEDFSLVNRLHSDFVTDGMRMRSLLMNIMDTEAYRAGSLTLDATEETQDRELTVRLMGPPQLAATIESITGFQWAHRGELMLDSDPMGYRVLAGGVDGEALTAPQQDPGLTWALVIKRLSEAGALMAVDAIGTGDAAGNSIFSDYDLNLRPDDLGFDLVLDSMSFRLTGVRWSESDLASLGALWQTVEQSRDANEAWAAVLIALLRDPLFVSY